MAECTNNDGLKVSEQFYNVGSRILGREITDANLLLGAGLYSNVLSYGSSSTPTEHSYIIENKINPEEDKLIQFATPEVANQGDFSYRTYDNGLFSEWITIGEKQKTFENITISGSGSVEISKDVTRVNIIGISEVYNLSVTTGKNTLDELIIAPIESVYNLNLNINILLNNGSVGSSIVLPMDKNHRFLFYKDINLWLYS